MPTTVKQQAHPLLLFLLLLLLLLLALSCSTLSSHPCCSLFPSLLSPPLCQ